jgi:hypothetical protein
MKQSNEQTYNLTNLLPSDTVEGWERTYKQFYVYCVANPDALKKHDDFAKLVMKVKKFLKSKGVKFI